VFSPTPKQPDGQTGMREKHFPLSLRGDEQAKKPSHKSTPPSQARIPPCTQHPAFPELLSLGRRESSGRAVSGAVLLPAPPPQPGSIPGGLRAVLEWAASLGLPNSAALPPSTAPGREVTLFCSHHLLQHRRWLCLNSFCSTKIHLPELVCLLTVVNGFHYSFSPF